MWANFDDVILYRGTPAELENEDVKITLYDSSGLFKSKMGEKIISFRGVVDFERLKTELSLPDEDGEKFSVIAQGFVSIDGKPKYRQTGQNVMLISTRKYLVLKIMRVENIRPAESRGIVDSFIAVEWCGMNQRTRTIKENNNPTFNELLYFQVPLPTEYLLDIEKYLLKINEELRTKNEVIFNLMIEGDDNTYDNFGIGYFYLSEIKGGNKMENVFFAEDLKKNKKYFTEKFTGKIKLISAFSQSNSTFLHFEAWFLENFPPSVDFGEKKKKSERADKVPQELQRFFPPGQDCLFIKEFKRKIAEVFRRYSSYQYQDRTFFNLNPQDQYTNQHLLPYFVSPITVPEKFYSKEDRETNPNFFDCNLTTLDEIAHYVRCFPYPQEGKNDIWSSPDFMLKLRKGNLEDHAILMACLMMGIRRKVSEIKLHYDLDDKPFDQDIGSALMPNGMTTKEPITLGTDKQTAVEKTQISTAGMKTITPEADIIISEMIDETVFPYENRIFVCQGKLKETKANYLWVMSFSEDYRDVTFWDPKLFTKFELKGRVSECEKLRKFLNGKFSNYYNLRMGIEDENIDQKEVKEDDQILKKKVKKRKDPEEVVLLGEDEDYLVKFEGNDEYRDEIVNDNDSMNKQKNVAKKLVDQVLYEVNVDEKKETFDFVKNDPTIDAELKSGSEKNFLPRDDFKTSTGEYAPQVVLPYDTIDLIFNRNNIYANVQCHNPDHIYYNLYDKTTWFPFFYIDETIWRGKFEPFYSLCNFGPVYPPSLVLKMTEALIKEMRVGIAASRSGKNLPTKFKKKNEKINKQLKKYLDFMENKHINRISEQQFQEKKKQWEVIAKKYMPKFYRMEAQPLFFSFFETEIIRRSVHEDLEDFYSSKIKNIMFATSAKVYAYPNQIVSVRIILAKFYKIPLEDIADKEEQKEYKEMEKEDPNKLVEQEVDSDEEEDLRQMQIQMEKMEKEKKENEGKQGMITNNQTKEIGTKIEVQNVGEKK